MKLVLFLHVKALESFAHPSAFMYNFIPTHFLNTTVEIRSYSIKQRDYKDHLWQTSGEVVSLLAELRISLLQLNGESGE